MELDHHIMYSGDFELLGSHFYWVTTYIVAYQQPTTACLRTWTLPGTLCYQTRSPAAAIVEQPFE